MAGQCQLVVDVVQTVWTSWPIFCCVAVSEAICCPYQADVLPYRPSLSTQHQWNTTAKLFSNHQSLPMVRGPKGRRDPERVSTFIDAVQVASWFFGERKWVRVPCWLHQKHSCAIQNTAWKLWLKELHLNKTRHVNKKITAWDHWTCLECMSSWIENDFCVPHLIQIK